MTTNAMGPTFAGGMQPIVEEGYELLYLPDINNAALQREGKPAVFYWLPNYVHIARKGGSEAGDFMFNLIRFAGVQSADTTVGMTEGSREVAGGVLTFTATSAPPDRVLAVSQAKIIKQWSAQPDYFWGIRGVVPVFRPAIITSNITTISNISPIASKGMPAYVRSRGGSRAPTFRVTPSAAPPNLPTRVREDQVQEVNLDPWYWQMQGQGAASIDASGQNAYSALIGAYPTAILWEAFHGAASPIVVNQALKLKVWSPVVELRIAGNWKKIFDHFSAAAHAHYLWASADIQAEINNMRTNGTLEIDVKVDQTIPGADKIAEQLDKRSEMILNKFMEEAQKVIFDPPPAKVEPAHASGGVSPWGVGVALKARHDETHLELDYHETRQFAYLQEHTISSSLEGMYAEIKKDPKAEKKYFLSVALDDWPRKIARVFKPVVNWATQPVAFVSAQVGYPNAQGELQWTGKLFQKTDGDDATWRVALSQKQKSDVTNPPAGWEPDMTFIKRKIHMKEPDDIFANPYVINEIDQNEIDLDLGPSGVPLNDTTLEIRADSAGRLAVGPIGLGGLLENASQLVEVTFDATDSSGASLGRAPVKLAWRFQDQDTPRFWSIFTGDPAFRPCFRYMVTVTIKGTLFHKGQSWEGPWQQCKGNGPLTINLPAPDEKGVTQRDAPPVMVMDGKGEVTRAGAASTASRLVARAQTSGSIAGWGTTGDSTEMGTERSSPSTPVAATETEVSRSSSFTELEISPLRRFPG
jgi:hypothetical protein